MVPTVVLVVDDDPVTLKPLTVLFELEGHEVCSATQATDVRAALDAGAADRVTKPFEPLDLVSRVEAVLGR